MSGLLLSKETVGTALRLVTSLAAQMVPGTVGAGVTLIDDRGRPTSRGSSDEVVAEADRLQYELDEGPCLMAWRERVDEQRAFAMLVAMSRNSNRKLRDVARDVVRSPRLVRHRRAALPHGTPVAGRKE